MRVLVTGGTGLVGRPLVERLRARGDHVVRLSRRPQADDPPNLTSLVGDPCERGPWLEAIATCDAVIHLAGEPVAQRWTKRARQRIHASRVASTTLIAEALAQTPHRADGTPKVFLCSSGIGYYGAYRANATEFTEADLPGTGFLANVCVAWEKATQPAATAGVRVVNLRTGMVLATHGGALPPLAKLFRWYVGGVIGGGKQWISWLHLDDMVGLFLFALDQPAAHGPLNAVAPESMTNWGFAHGLAKALRRPCWLPTPAFALRLFLGAMAELATHGQRVRPTKAAQLGYDFRYPLLTEALGQLYHRPT